MNHYTIFKPFQKIGSVIFVTVFLVFTTNVVGLAQNEIELRTDGIVVPRIDSATVSGPTLGQVIYDTNTASLLYYNGTSWDAIGGPFERTGNLVRQKDGYETDDFVFGREALPPATAISDTLFFFDKSKGAFRGGNVSNDANWAPDSIGDYSFAFGLNSMAQGTGATAFGRLSTATTISATAIGNRTTASGANSTALGQQTIADGFASVALGDNAFAFGGNSIAIGEDVTALGRNSTAFGKRTTATGELCTVFGRFNDTIVASGQDLISISPLFIIGNGDGGTGNESNAIVVRKDGRVGIGENDPDALVHVFSDTTGIEAGLKITSTGALQINSLLYHDANGHLFLRKQTHADQLVLSANNLVGLGKIPAANKLEVEGDASKTEAGNWMANSDRRIKTDIHELENATDILRQLRPVKFKYTDEWRARHPSIKDHYYYNFIAQDFQKIFPDAVQGSGEYLENDDEEILQIDTYNAQIMTIAAVKELIEEIEQLKVELKALKSQQRNNNHSSGVSGKAQ